MRRRALLLLHRVGSVYRAFSSAAHCEVQLHAKFDIVLKPSAIILWSDVKRVACLLRVVPFPEQFGELGLFRQTVKIAFELLNVGIGLFHASRSTLPGPTFEGFAISSPKTSLQPLMLTLNTATRCPSAPAGQMFAA